MANFAHSFKFAKAVPSGTCGAPSPQSPTKPTPSWTTTVRGCGPKVLAACEGASECVGGLTAAAPFDQTCVFAPGDRSCPAEYPTKQAAAFQDFDDQRTCPECKVSYVGDCDNYVGGATQSATCTGTVSTFPPFDQCFNPLASNTVGLKLDGFIPVNGLCGGPRPDPTGNVVPKTPVSVCCL